MTDDRMLTQMKHATETAIALVTAMQSRDTFILDKQLAEAVSWIGLNTPSAESERLALQLNQSTHLTTLCIELLAAATEKSVEATTQRLAALIARHNS